MEFSSVEFLAFLIITLFLSYLVRPSYRWIILLVASAVFIYSFSLSFLIFTICFALFNYAAGLAVSRSTKPLLKTFLYQASIVINIGLLVFYKYTNFLIDNILALTGRSSLVTDGPYLKLIIPLGISFFTFQSIGYIIDVKRGTRPAETNPGKFLLFILYFPKFISGPVERTGTLLPQLNKDINWSEQQFYDGLLQMLWGFFKTIVISDRLAFFVNSVNGDITGSSGGILILNFFVQFFYLYFNFSGYTDIVLGISKMFGINLINNFSRPIFATSVTEYWKRWHISLTTWCNDYIFKRVILKRIKWGKWASVYAVFLTFIIIGIWHGASWNFVILGLLQGIAINYEFFTKKSRLKVSSRIPVWLNLSLSRIFTLIFISVSHVFFFTKDLNEAMLYFSGMFGGKGYSGNALNTGLATKDLILVATGFIIVLASEYRDETGKKPLKMAIINNRLVFWIVAIASAAILIFAGINKSAGFIYEQF